MRTNWGEKKRWIVAFPSCLFLALSSNNFLKTYHCFNISKCYFIYFKFLTHYLKYTLRSTSITYFYCFTILLKKLFFLIRKIFWMEEWKIFHYFAWKSEKVWIKLNKKNSISTVRNKCQIWHLSHFMKVIFCAWCVNAKNLIFNIHDVKCFLEIDCLINSTLLYKR